MISKWNILTLLLFKGEMCYSVLWMVVFMIQFLCMALYMIMSFVGSFSESSMFVTQSRFILKTCGRTTLLLAVEPLMELVQEQCGFKKVLVSGFCCLCMLWHSRRIFLILWRTFGIQFCIFYMLDDLFSAGLFTGPPSPSIYLHTNSLSPSPIIFALHFAKEVISIYFCKSGLVKNP